ncbi:WD40 repeat-like protein, partial [Lentinus tigrinus ALCF2SS1-7]|uniref:WD40 repeat-like protein n=1 Tax=Lentinus tigrinus ALCF2SS1-7 TaxID=1328758 RepID=UPI0011660092
EDLGHDSRVTAIAASPDSRYFATGTQDGTIMIWSTIAYPLRSLLEICASSTSISTLAFSDTGNFLAAIHTEEHDVLTGHTNYVNAACFSPCEQYIATVSYNNTVCLWSVMNGSLIWRFEDHGYARVEHVIFSGDGSTLASADDEGQVVLHPISRFIRSDVSRAPLTD